MSKAPLTVTLTGKAITFKGDEHLNAISRQMYGITYLPNPITNNYNFQL